MRPTFFNLLRVVRRSRSCYQTSICRQRVSSMLRHDDFVIDPCRRLSLGQPADLETVLRAPIPLRAQSLIRQGPAGRSSVKQHYVRSGYTRGPQVEHGGCNRIEAQATLASAKVVKSFFRLSTASIYATIFLATASVARLRFPRSNSLP